MHVSYPYALLSDLAYAIDFADLTAKTPTTLSGGTPFNYTAKALYQNSAFTSNNTALTGFAAKSSDFAVTVFQNGSQYVIAFRGSDSTADIKDSALPFRGIGRGNYNDQVRDAIEFVRAFMDQVSGNVVLTGHSLGGALAGIAGSYFNLDTYTIAPVPYQTVATNAAAGGEMVTTIDPDTQQPTQTFNPYPTPANATGTPFFSKLHNYRIDGEIAGNELPSPTPGEVVRWNRPSGFSNDANIVNWTSPFDQKLHSVSTHAMVSYGEGYGAQKWKAADHFLYLIVSEPKELYADGQGQTPAAEWQNWYDFTNKLNFRPGQDTGALDSLFDDMEGLGKRITEKSGGLLGSEAVRDALSKISIQFSARLVGQSVPSGGADRDGVLDFNETSASIDLDETTTWSGVANGIVAKPEFVTSVFSTTGWNSVQSKQRVATSLSVNDLRLPPGLHELIGNRLDQIRDRRAGAGLDVGLDRHSGNQLQAAEAGNLALWQRDPDGVVTQARLLILSDIRRDELDLAADLRRGALVECGEAQHHGLTDPDLVDGVRCDPGLDGQHVASRDDQHDRLAGGDDTSHRMDGELMDAAVLRRADVDALERVLGRNPLLDQLGRLRPDFGQLLADLAAKVLIDLQDLKPGFGDLSPGLRDRRDQRSSFSPEARRVPLQCRHACDLDEVLAPQLTYAVELLDDELDLAILGDDLLLEAADKLLDLRDPLVELRLLPRARRAAQLEEHPLSGKDARNGRIGPARGEVFRKGHLGFVVPLRFKPRLSRRELIQALEHHGEVGARDGLIQAYEKSAGVDLIPVADVQLRHDTPGRVLYFLRVRIHHEGAGGYHRAGDLGRASPAADTAGQDDRGPEGEAEVKAERRSLAPV